MLFEKLFNKTKELGRQVTFQEAEDDPNLPNPNDYAFYYGSFSDAASQAWYAVKRGDQVVRLNDRLKGVENVSKKQQKWLANETQKEVKKMENEKMGRRYTPEECKKLLGEACREAGHVLTQLEVCTLSDELPGWATLQRQIGYWWYWSEMFDVPFANEKQRRLAAVKLQEEQDEIVQETLEPEEVVSVTEPEDEVEPIREEPTAVPVTEQDEVDVKVIPIKLIVPKGLKGSVQISVEF